EHPDRREHDVHRAGHHRPRGGEPHARVPGLRRWREDRRRRDARAQGPRRARRARLRHGRPGRRVLRQPDLRLRRHGPPRVHEGRCLRGDREPHQARRDRHRAHPAPGRRADGRARRHARRADHRAQLPWDHRARRHQDGRNRRPGQERRAGLLPRSDRRRQPLRRHDDGDVLDADGRRPRPVDRRLDRRRRDHRFDVRRADAVLPGRQADARDRHLHRARRSDGGRALAVGDRQRLPDAGRRVHGRALHGRDAGHELRPCGHDRRGQGGHRGGEDRAPRRRGHHGRRGDLRDPGHHEIQAAGARRAQASARCQRARLGARRGWSM
ncbi:MAG: Succinyl-CoA ligase [ADP-forming] alpha chain, partial [uncultured Solirubrobacteraceae bacterium]